MNVDQRAMKWCGTQSLEEKILSRRAMTISFRSEIGDEDDNGRIIEDSDQEDLEPELDGSRRRHERSERPADPGVMEDEMFTAALGELTTTLGSRYNLDHIDDD
ncbi:hypothetical protein E4U45_005248 [Claviceps purpurea]|nr:hypothetical protein E4U45_005248 [Claviceps purpurea]